MTLETLVQTSFVRFPRCGYSTELPPLIESP